jgi:peptide/nickel transport system substrate-binding protein
MMISRRTMMGGGLAIAAGAQLWRSGTALAQAGKTLTIAYNVNLPAWDPTVGPSAVNPTIQSLYQAVFDQYIDQKPDLSFGPGLIEKWGWNADKTKISLQVRKGVVWHDGTPLTPEDVVWSLERAAKKETGNPIQFTWAKVGNYKIDGATITGDVLEFEPAFFEWLGFLTAYVMPKAYYEKVGAAGFEAKPIGTGPYMVDHFERNAFLRLKANPHYWAGKPAIDTVVFKFVTDASARVAEIESGGSDIAIELPYEEYDRLRKKPGLGGVATPVSDIGMIFLTNIAPMLDKNVRLAAAMSIDKKLIASKLLSGYAVPIDTLQTPEYMAYDSSIKVPYDPAKAAALLKASGYSTAKPVTFKIQTTRGFKPKDYEMIQAIVGMWRKVGINAEIEVYEIAKHFELRMAHQLAPAAFYNWGDSIGDPSCSTGFAMFPLSPHSAWREQDMIARMGPLWSEKDQAKRIAGYKALDRYIADNGLVIPLVQYKQPIVFKSAVKVVPYGSGVVRPDKFKLA